MSEPMTFAVCDCHGFAPASPPAAEQPATGTPTTPSTDNEPQRAERGAE